MASSSLPEELVYDEIRKLWVHATPEEHVRQSLLKKMIEGLSYPRELLSVEVSLSELCKGNFAQKVPNRRVDIVCFFSNPKSPVQISPLLVIECKERAELQEDALEQVKGYNCFLKAPFIAVAHPAGEVLGCKTEKGFSFLPYLPKYSDLIRAITYV